MWLCDPVGSGRTRHADFDSLCSFGRSDRASLHLVCVIKNAEPDDGLSIFCVDILCDLRFAEVVDAVLEGFDFGFGIGLFFALVFDDFGFGIGYEFFVAELFHYRI